MPRAIRPADHPRMRGEHNGWHPHLHVLFGSSPHARGTLDVEAARCARERIIPACAGNTVPQDRFGWPGPDHPRMRGEHGRPQAGTTITGGSSPHARGTLTAVCPVDRLTRIIPACAGNTNRDRTSDRRSTDHPRMRGEHRSKPWNWTSRTGSSPHARGTRPGHPSGAKPRRIIPACAGNTW